MHRSVMDLCQNAFILFSISDPSVKEQAVMGRRRVY